MVIFCSFVHQTEISSSDHSGRLLSSIGKFHGPGYLPLLIREVSYYPSRWIQFPINCTSLNYSYCLPRPAGSWSCRWYLVPSTPDSRGWLQPWEMRELVQNSRYRCDRSVLPVGVRFGSTEFLCMSFRCLDAAWYIFKSPCNCRGFSFSVSVCLRSSRV